MLSRDIKADMASAGKPQDKPLFYQLAKSISVTVEPFRSF
jgi:hypothetical protein